MPFHTTSSKYRPLQVRIQNPTRDFSRSIQSLTRILRCQALQQITKWRFTSEKPKTALYQSRKTAITYMLLHLVPLFGAITLVGLNVCTLYLGQWTGTSTTVLQFAAKLLEILMQASLTAIVLAFVRSQVLSNTAIPFGGIFAPYRSTDVSYLWSLDFWGTATSSSFIGSQKVLFCVLVPCFIVLGALVGPSSAILMIPRLDNFPSSKGFSFSGDHDFLFPSSLDLENITTSCIAGLQGCNFTLGLRSELDFNLTIDAIVSGNRRESTLIQDTSGGWAKRVVLMPHLEAPGAITRSPPPRISSNSTIPTQFVSSNMCLKVSADKCVAKSIQPAVFMDCRVSDPTETGYLKFGEGKESLDTIIPMRVFNSSLISADETLGAYRYTTEYGNYTNIWWPNSNHSILLATTLGPDSTSVWPPYACTIDAYWGSTITIFDGTGVKIIRNVDATTELSNKSSDHMITLSAAWANRVSNITSTHYNDFTSSSELLTYLAPSFALALSDYSFPLDVYGSDGVDPDSSLQGSHAWDYYTSVDIPDVGTHNSDPAIEWQAYFVGYGYNSFDLTVKLSLAVVLTYILVVLVFVTYSLGMGYTATSWDSISELVALALNSERPDGLPNTSVGIDTLETFRQPVRILVAEDDSCGLVFGRTAVDVSKKYRVVEVNEKY